MPCVSNGPHKTSMVLCTPREKEPHVIEVDRGCNLMHLPCLNAFLPQQLLPTSDAFLNVLWVSQGYIIQLSGRLSVLWLAGNLAISLFLAQLHSHLSLSSLSLFPGILRP